MDRSASSPQRAEVSTTGASRPSGTDRQPDLVDAGLLLLRHGRLTLGVPILLATVVVGLSLLRPRTYTAAGAFAPQAAGNSLARFAGVAAQLGVAIPTPQANESADFYADLLKSRQLLGQLVQSRYVVGSGGDPTGRSLIDLFEIAGSDSARREDRAIRRLARSLRASVTSKTGVVNFQVTTRDPVLSERIAERVLQVLNEFNLQRRQSRAGAERRFVEGRLADAQTDLRAVEDRLQAWLQQNRDYRDSPRLMFQFQRLQNQVTLKEGVVTTLAQAFEQARIDEVRDTPVLTVVEEPVVPSRPNGRRIVAKAILALILGGGLGALLGAFRESARRVRQERPDAVAEARTLVRRLLPRRASP